MRIHGTTQRAKKAMRLGKATGFSSPEYMPFGAVFRIFCKRDFCVEVRDFKISEPEAESSHRRRRLELDGLPGKMLR